MQVHTDIDSLPLFKHAAVTIGTFDGVHSGHLKIIDQLKTEALQNNGESVIITFHPHPKMVVSRSNDLNSTGIQLLNTLEEKIELLSQQQVDHLVIVPFTEAFSELSATDYIKKFLIEKFHPTTIITGYDHHFGKGRSGNYKLLEIFAKKGNFIVKEIPQYILDHVGISSTRIREAITSGDLNTSNKFLGYDYYFSGEVIHGDKIGRTLGYPTANINIGNSSKLIPCNGVYIVEVKLRERMLQGMMSIGVRPAVGGKKQTIEVNIFDFNEDIYGCKLKVILKKYLRPELDFLNLTALTNQIKADEKEAKAYFTR